MSTRFIKPAIALILAALIFSIGFYACSKSDGYGNNGGNGTGNKVSIKNFAFSINSLSVATGAMVTWTNNDGTAHTVTSDDGSFDSGNIPAGGTFSHTFSTAGTFNYHCNIHTTMTAKVVVN